MRRLTTILAALALALGVAAGTPASAQADNTAIAINTKDGSSVFKFAFAIRQVMGDVVDETNSAVAYASCTDCSTTAIAIEIVLVGGSPSTFTPTNQAIAINYLCNLCNTFAAAYQFVIQGAGPMHFTHDALTTMARIRKQIRELQDQDLSPFELRAALDPLIDQLKSVLVTGLMSGPPAADQNDDQDPSSEGPLPTVPPGGQAETSTGPEATATVPPGTTTGTDATTTAPPPATTTSPETTTPTTTAETGTTPTSTTPETTTMPAMTTTTTTATTDGSTTTTP
jgi:putative peptide zinc metalloprotease protein